MIPQPQEKYVQYEFQFEEDNTCDCDFTHHQAIYAYQEYPLSVFHELGIW